MDHVKDDGTFEDADFDALGATLRKMDVNESSLVVLTLPNTSGHRWSLGRINKLGNAVRKRGGELIVMKTDGTQIDLNQNSIEVTAQLGKHRNTQFGT